MQSDRPPQALRVCDRTAAPTVAARGWQGDCSLPVMPHVQDAAEACRALIGARKPQEAEALARQAHDDLAKLHGDGSVEACRGLATLGEVLVRINRPKDAFEPLTAAFKALAPHADERRRAAELLDWMGIAYEKLGDLPHAEQAFVDGLRLREQALGQKAPEIADSMDHLYHLYHDLRHDGARDLAHSEEVLKRALTVLAGAGPEHLPHMVLELVALGELYEQEARWFDALRCFERAVRLRAQLEGIESSGLSPLLRQLGRAYRHVANLDAAEYCCRRAVLLVDANHGGTPRRALPYVLDLIDVLRDAGKTADENAFRAIAQTLRTQSILPPAPS